MNAKTPRRQGKRSRLLFKYTWRLGILAFILIVAGRAFAADVAMITVIPKPMQVEQTGRTATLKAIERELTAGPALGDEGYILDTTGEAIRIYADKPAGLFYAEQTLDQLLFS